ncbi:MAG: hypothetical protein J07HX5_01902, partial [halophilic archaeon J07HX5]
GYVFRAECLLDYPLGILCVECCDSLAQWLVACLSERAGMIGYVRQCSDAVVGHRDRSRPE